MTVRGVAQSVPSRPIVVCCCAVPSLVGVRHNQSSSECWAGVFPSRPGLRKYPLTSKRGSASKDAIFGVGFGYARNTEAETIANALAA